MNHDRNSSTVTGQDRKKQGPEEGKEEHIHTNKVLNIPSEMEKKSSFLEVTPRPDMRGTHTDEEVRRAVLLQEGMQMIPQFGHPVQHPDQVLVGQASLVLRLHQLPVQVPHQEAVGRLHIVGEGHHSKTVKGTSKKSY